MRRLRGRKVWDDEERSGIGITPNAVLSKEPSGSVVDHVALGDFSGCLDLQEEGRLYAIAVLQEGQGVEGWLAFSGCSFFLFPALFK